MTTPRIIYGLDARYRAGRRYELMAPFIYRSAIAGVGTITVPRGFITDFHSVPRFLWAIFPPDDYAEAAVSHDWLYEHAEVTDEDGTRAITRAQADDVHRELMRHCGASAPHANTMHRALRIGGWKAWRDYRQKQRETAHV